MKEDEGSAISVFGYQNELQRRDGPKGKMINPSSAYGFTNAQIRARADLRAPQQNASWYADHFGGTVPPKALTHHAASAVWNRAVSGPYECAS